jgi:hypothetical protein
MLLKNPPLGGKGRINAVQLGRLDVPFAVFVLGP